MVTGRGTTNIQYTILKFTFFGVNISAHLIYFEVIIFQTMCCGKGISVNLKTIRKSINEYRVIHFDFINNDSIKLIK